MLPHPLTNMKVLSKWTKFNGVYSINNSPKIKEWAHVIHLDEFKLIETLIG